MVTVIVTAHDCSCNGASDSNGKNSKETLMKGNSCNNDGSSIATASAKMKTIAAVIVQATVVVMVQATAAVT